MKKLTRQKKELLKKIEQLETWIAADEELGCGFAPPGAYDDMYREIDQLREKLAHLRHYKTVEEMYYDERKRPTIEEIEEMLWQAEPVQNLKRKRSRNNSRGMGR